MPRIEMTRKVRITLLLLKIYLVVMAGLIVFSVVSAIRKTSPTPVTAGVLYRFCQPDIKQMAALADQKITTVVNLRAPKEDDNAYGVEEQFCREHGIELVDIPVVALLPTDDQVKQFLDVMARQSRENKGAVLVHCAQGRNRTGMMVAAFRIVFEDWSGEKALKEMQDFGSDRDNDKGRQKADFVMGISKDRQKWRQAAGLSDSGKPLTTTSAATSKPKP